MAGWFSFESLNGSFVYDVFGLVQYTTNACFPCVTIPTALPSKLQLKYDAETLDTTLTLTEFEWYFISTWVNRVDGTYGICIGGYDPSVST